MINFLSHFISQFIYEVFRKHKPANDDQVGAKCNSNFHQMSASAPTADSAVLPSQIPQKLCNFNFLLSAIV